MTDRLCIGLAQINHMVGDLNANLSKIIELQAVGAGQGADLVVFPELAVTGYPPEDLVLKPYFLNQVEAAIEQLCTALPETGPAMLIGAPWRDKGRVFNASILIESGQISAVRLKHDLPNYGVFDEKRVFVSGPLPGPINFNDVRLGIVLCEDMWTPDVSEALAECGAEMLIVQNGSPFETTKQETRLNLAVARVCETGLPLIYLNRVGGQDELVFDGNSFVLSAEAALVAHAPSFEESLMMTRWERVDQKWCCVSAPTHRPTEGLEAIYQALMLGLRDYVNRNGFPGVVLGLSGGIDSALSAAIAVDALGADRVHLVMMPSSYTSAESLEDAEAVAQLLKCRFDTLPIQPGMTAFDDMLSPLFSGCQADVTEENIQARIRGLLLMAISNKFGPMVLATGNKSEYGVGYATLYGDMCGGFAILKDVYKTTVYALSVWRNQQRPQLGRGPESEVIPQRILTKPPSAELRANQTDQDSLPPYDALDDILDSLVEHDRGLPEIIERGHEPETVEKVRRLLDGAEYKRRQAPPGVKISRRSFGKERRYPITSGFKNIL